MDDPRHEHRCPDCGRSFRCTATACAQSSAYACVCCKLDAISKRLAWTYEDYMRSAEWTARREIELERAGHQCQRCGVGGFLEVHHLHYRTLGDERDGDLEVVCKPCHKVADREREARTKAENAVALFEARLEGWARKKYGEDWYHDYGAVAEDFQDWLENR